MIMSIYLKKSFFLPKVSGSEGGQPPARLEHLKEFVAVVGGVRLNLFCML